MRERYPDFGPTLAHEKLTELHELSVSVETLRKWMIAAIMAIYTLSAAIRPGPS